MRASVKNRIAFGMRSGKKVQEIGVFIHQGFGYTKESAVLQGDRCASQNGFSIHANTHIKGIDWKG